MIECLDCHCYFFLNESLKIHRKICIGYKPEVKYDPAF